MQLTSLPPSQPTIRVVLADDHALIRSGLRALLSTIARVDLAGEADDGQTLLALVDSVNPDLVITDLSMPGMDGFSAIRTLRARDADLAILALSMHDSPDHVRRAVACGANGYLLKTASPGELAHAIGCVIDTGRYFGSDVAASLLQKTEPTAEDELTPRQIEIVRLLARGLASKQVAHELNLSSKTVDVHRSRIMQRLRINDTASLTRYALRKGLAEI